VRSLIAITLSLIGCSPEIAPQQVIVTPAPVVVEVVAPPTTAKLVAQPEDPQTAVEVTGNLSDLDKTFTSDNGLISINYPHHWKAENSSVNVVQISRPLPHNEDEDLTFISIAVPISNNLTIFNDTVINAEIPYFGSYSESSRKLTNCAAGVPGVEILSTWVPQNGVTYMRWTCTFLLNGHGFSFAYDLPEDKVRRDDALMQSMVTSVTFH
jgi:hypothetical protein